MSSGESDNVYIADLPGDIDNNMIHAVFANYGTVMSCRAMPSKFPGQKGAALVRFSNADEAAWLVENLNGNIAEGLTEPIKVRFANNKGAGGKGGGGGGGGGGNYGKASAGGEDDGSGLSVPVLSMPGRGGPYQGQSGGGKSNGKGRGKGPGKAGTYSTADMQTVIAGLIKSLPGSGRKPDENCLYITGLPMNTTDVDLYKMFAPFGAIPATGVKAKMQEDGSCSGVGWVDYDDASSALAAMTALSGMTLPDGVQLNITIKKAKGAPKTESAEVDEAAIWP